MMISSFCPFALTPAQNAGNELESLGLIKGDQAGNLNEDQPLNREQAVAILIRMMGKTEEAKAMPSKQEFKDVPANHWAAKDLAYAKKQGWTNGIDGENFGVGQNVTLQQYLTFMMRALGQTGDNVYANAMKLAKEKNLLSKMSINKAETELKRGDAFILMSNTLGVQVADASGTLAAKFGLNIKTEVTKAPDTTIDGKGTSAPINVGMTWAIKEIAPTSGGNPWSLTSCGISESVFMQNEKGELVSRFVKEYKQLDALTWELKLNEGVKFSDGSVVDAKAFATSMNQVMKENPLSNATAGVIKFEATGDYTVKATTERETKVLNSVLCEWTNIIFKDLGNGQYVFTGPFKVKNLDSGIALSLEPNTYYPDAEKRSEVVIKALKDVSAMKMAMESGEIDMAFTITPEVADMLKNEGITVKTIEAGYQYFAPINLKGVMADLKLRQAVNLAVNRNDYITALGGGHFPTGIFASYNSFAGKVKVEFDVEKAKTLLDEAGYKLNAKGMREKDGKYDIALYAQHTSPTGKPAFYLNQFYRTDGPKNMMGYSSKKFDAVLDKMGAEKLGTEMDKLAQEAQEILYTDLPALYLDDPQWHVAVSERLKGYQPYCGDYYIINNQLFAK